MTKEKILELIKEEDQKCQQAWFDHYVNQHPAKDKMYAQNQLQGWDNLIVIIEPGDDRWPVALPTGTILALTIEGSDLEFFVKTESEKEVRKKIQEYFIYPN